MQNAGLGDSILISNGINLSKIKDALPKTNKFKWIEPPLAPIGNIIPTESTYHPLITNSKHEIAGYLFSIEGSDMSDQQKEVYKQKVQKVVEMGPFIQSRAVFFAFLIVTVILLIVSIFIKIEYSIIGILAILTMVTGVNAYFFAEGYGKTKWIDFENDLQSQINAGILPTKILENFRQEEQNQKMIDAMRTQRSAPQNSGFTIRF